MPTGRPLFAVRCGCLLCLCLLPLSGQGQQAVRTAPALGASRNRDPLAGDHRLEKKVTLRKREGTVEEILDQLRAISGVEFRSRHTGIRQATLSLSYRETPLRAILEDIAKAGDWEWRRETDGGLTLQFRYDPHRLDALRPHTKEEAEKERRGREFLDQLGGQSPELQAALLRPIKDPDNNGIRFGDLPPEMQQNLQAMLASRLTELGPGFEGVKTQLGDPQNARIYLQVGPGPDVTNYSLTFGVPTAGGDGCIGSVDMSFFVFNDPREDYHTVPAPDVQARPRTVESPARHVEDTRQVAVAEDARLNMPVSLNLQNGSLGDALLALSAQEQINVLAVSAYDIHTSSKHSLIVKATPLKDALDRIATEFRYAWEEQPSGAILFHPERSESERADAPSTAKT